jgi:hypothetical protein
MEIRHKTSGLKAIVGKVGGGVFVIVDEHGNVQTLDRFYAGEWELAK